MTDGDRPGDEAFDPALDPEADDGPRPDQIDLRRPAIGFFLAIGGALFAGAIGGGPLLEILPLAVLLGALFAVGMWAAQRFGPRE